MLENAPLNLLQSDHQEVQELFDDYRETSPADYDQRKDVAEKIFFNLKVHSKLEEELFYPEIEKISPEGQQIIVESKNDHKEIENMIETAKNIDIRSELYNRNIEDLEVKVNHHVEEEEGRVFPFAQERIGGQLDATLAAKMLAFKQKYKVEQII